MKVFDRYAMYYDLLYKDKDYAGEATYALGLLSDCGVIGGTLLELGCGTGKHAAEFARAGLEVEGYDLSSEMIVAANTLEKEASSRMTFRVGDARTLRTGRKYDAIVSLFHVASYQTKNSDLSAMFETAAEHLAPNGVFLFDCWYGPGVLADPPAIRIKRMEDQEHQLIRIAEPELHLERNVVDVKYTIFISDRVGGPWTAIEEIHSMRYFFEPEIGILLNRYGMRAHACLHWGTRVPAHAASWQCMFVARPA